jgi:hypothetical protein
MTDPSQRLAEGSGLHSRYPGISCVTNRAAGLSLNAPSHAQVGAEALEHEGPRP